MVIKGEPIRKKKNRQPFTDGDLMGPGLVTPGILCAWQKRPSGDMDFYSKLEKEDAKS